MKLQRLGSFHQSKLSFTRQLINELQCNKSQFEISEWNIDQNGFGNAVIQTIFNNNTFSLVVFLLKDRQCRVSPTKQFYKYFEKFTQIRGGLCTKNP